jgi:hypothetical protein
MKIMPYAFASQILFASHLDMLNSDVFEPDL